MAQNGRPQIDLSDENATQFRLSCGGSYATPGSICVTCGSEQVTHRDTLMSRLYGAAFNDPGFVTQPGRLVSIPGLSSARIGSVSVQLTAAHIAHLLLGGGNRLLQREDAENAESILIPAACMDRVRGLLRMKSAPGVSDEDDGSDSRFDALVCLKVVAEVEAEVLQSLLKAADVPFLAQHAPPQLGLTVGDFGTVRILVEREDLARAEEALTRAPMNEVSRGAGEKFRLQHRYRITRFFMVLVGLAMVALGTVQIGIRPPVALLQTGIGIAILALATYSIREPERAFGLALVVLFGAIISNFFVGPLLVSFPGVLTLLAVFYAFEASVAASKAQETIASRSNT